MTGIIKLIAFADSPDEIYSGTENTTVKNKELKRFKGPPTKSGVLLAMNLSKDKTYALITKCGEGDPDALKRFFEDYAEDIYNFPIKVFHLGEDDASDFFLYAFERLKTGRRFKSFQGKSSFRTWFYSVLRNMVIDWQRTKRELKITNLGKKNEDGKEFGTIEDEPDERSEIQREAEEMSDQFQSVLDEVPIDKRVVFKLSYLYYLNFTDQELEYLQEKTGLSEEELRSKIMGIRETLSEKESDNLQLEDKITSLYLNILDLKEKLKNAQSDGEAEISERLQFSIDKKYEQRRKLIEKKRKGHFVARTPYKQVAQILGITEGNVSVTLLRIIEKMQKKLGES